MSCMTVFNDENYLFTLIKYPTEFPFSNCSVARNKIMICTRYYVLTALTRKLPSRKLLCPAACVCHFDIQEVFIFRQLPSLLLRVRVDMTWQSMLHLNRRALFSIVPGPQTVNGP